MSPTPVLLHGFTGSPRSWDAVMRVLPGQACIAPALLGHGAPANEVVTFMDEVDRLARLLPHEPVHLCGYSLGARLALGLLVRHGERISGATLIGVNPGLSDPAAREQRLRHDAELARRLETAGIDAFVREWESQPLFATQAHLPGAVRARKRAERTSHDPHALARSLRVLGLGSMPDFWPALPRLGCPITLVAGARDDKFRELAVCALRVLPAARLRIVADAGHDLLVERPEEIAVLLREDLAAPGRHATAPNECRAAAG